MYPEQQFPQQQPNMQPNGYPQPQQPLQQTPAPQKSSYRRKANPLLIACIVLGVLSVGLAVFGGWSFMNYKDYKNNSDTKAELAVAAAKEEQAEVLEKDFLEREKQPNMQFVGPDDLGHVTFSYPKTWSLYIAENGATNYEAYLHPGAVPSVSQAQPYAVRVQILDKSYEDVLKSYDSAVKKGALRSNPITLNGFTGVRLDGEFSKERQGSSVIFKVRDKTLQISSDATTFKNDFDKTVLTSLDFNP